MARARIERPPAIMTYAPTATADAVMAPTTICAAPSEISLSEIRPADQNLEYANSIRGQGRLVANGR